MSVRTAKTYEWYCDRCGGLCPLDDATLVRNDRAHMIRPHCPVCGTWMQRKATVYRQWSDPVPEPPVHLAHVKWRDRRVSPALRGAIVVWCVLMWLGAAVLTIMERV